MPALYAHDRFGRKVFEQLNHELHDIIAKHYTQFQIGLQGPDIFFFYKPYSSNRVNRYGTHLHEISALPFLTHAKDIIQKKGCDSSEYAYLLGYICHFTLDSECHSYINHMAKQTGISHLEIESEFEKYLLHMDHKNPLSCPIWKLIPTDDHTAVSIYSFYETINPGIVKTSLQYYKIIKWFFTAPSSLHQHFILFLLRIIGKHDAYQGLLHHREDNPACTESNIELSNRFSKAIPVALELLSDYHQTLHNGKHLNVRFDRTFE